MISVLRFLGLVNAAVWLGAVVFFALAIGPACGSAEMEALLGPKNFPYFSGAFKQALGARYFSFLTLCSILALLHLLAEWLYMGRPARKFSMALLAILFGLVLMGGLWIEPRLKELHATRYAANAPPAERESAENSFRWWQVSAHAANLVMIAGLVVYVWRIANPSDAPRFISSVKFRG